MTTPWYHFLVLRSFNAKQGFGFIENPEAYAMFGRPYASVSGIEVSLGVADSDLHSNLLLSGMSSCTRHRLAT